MRSPREAEAAIRVVEQEYDLLQARVEGWCVWPLFRFPASMDLGSAPSGRTATLSRADILRLFASDLASLSSIGRARTLYKTYCSGLLDERAGRYRDVWFDDVLDTLGPDERSIKIDAINNPAFVARRPRAVRRASLSTIWIEVIAARLARARPVAGAIDAARLIAPALREALGLPQYTEEIVGARIRHFIWSKQLYTRLLRRVKPSLVLVADPGEYALIAAAKEAQVASAELQHGFLDGQSNSAYAWTSYATPHIDAMPVPDHLFLYGEHWRRELETNGFWGSRLEVTGNLRMETYRARAQPPRAAGSDAPHRVLVTSQGIAVAEIIRMLQQTLDAGGRLVEIAIKLHPVYEATGVSYDAAFAGDARVRVLPATSKASTFDLLREADVHVSVSSASHYDALALGVPTIVLALPSYEYMNTLVAAGHAPLVRTGDALWAEVGAARGRAVPESVRSYYFSLNARENIVSAIHRARTPRIAEVR